MAKRPAPPPAFDSHRHHRGVRDLHLRVVTGEMSTQSPQARGGKELKVEVERRVDYTHTEASGFEAIMGHLRNRPFQMALAIEDMRKDPRVRDLAIHMRTQEILVLTNTDKWKQWYRDWEQLQVLARTADAVPLLPNAIARLLAVESRMTSAAEKKKAAEERMASMKAVKPEEWGLTDDEDIFADDDSGGDSGGGE